MTKAGEKALIQYLGLLCSISLGDLSSKANITNIKETMRQITDIYENYEAAINAHTD